MTVAAHLLSQLMLDIKRGAYSEKKTNRFCVALSRGLTILFVKTNHYNPPGRDSLARFQLRF